MRSMGSGGPAGEFSAEALGLLLLSELLAATAVGVALPEFAAEADDVDGWVAAIVTKHRRARNRAGKGRGRRSKCDGARVDDDGGAQSKGGD